jgi:guanine deaminase
MPVSTAVRGHAISFKAIVLHRGRLVDIEDALIVSRDGEITSFGPYEETKGASPTGSRSALSRRRRFGSQLIDWLNNYTFIEEQRFADKGHAKEVAKLYFDQLLGNGTTTA